MTDPFAAFAALARGRRTTKAFDGSALARVEVERLLELACWAPTHRLTQPWRFYALDQAAIAALGRHLAGEPSIVAAPDPAKGTAKLTKLLERMSGAGALVLATWVRGADPAIDLEEHAAASAAAQNLLLGATAAGLASFWSTAPALVHPLTLAWCGADPAVEGALGMMWLGRSATVPPAPPRHPLHERLRWVAAKATP
jgi:nitroreductase